MATILGPDVMTDTLASESQDLAPPTALKTLSPEMSPLSTPQLSPRPDYPPPNPPFVFPARPSSSSQASYSRPTRNRSGPTLDLPGHARGPSGGNGSNGPSRTLALPDFSFPMAPPSPGAAEASFLSPPQSPQSPRAIPARPAGAGHRRGGSEFVGGSIRGGDSITVMGTSPTKSESGLASPNLAPSRPRRGHAHRRSAAISSHDLSSIILPSPTTAAAVKGSSAPTSPALYGRNDDFKFPASNGQAEQLQSMGSPKSESDIKKAATYSTPSEETQLTPRPIARNRVGFSDTLEFIPRPLSLVSSDTSSTATARPGHSVSGSISSVISLTNSTVAEREPSSLSRADPALKRSDSRPSTAGAVLERTQSTQDADQMSTSPRRRNSIPHLNPAAASTTVDAPTPSPTKTPKRWSFFGLEPFVGSHSPTRSRPVSAGSSESQPRTSTSLSSPPIEDEPKKSCAKEKKAKEPELKPLTRKRSKKQKKVKTWAGAILSRKKSKPRHVKHKRRTPTPPPRDIEAEDDLSEGGAEITAAPVMPTVMITEASALEDEDSRDVSRGTAASQDDASYPMIDLDAALGPFNTPLPRNPEWEAAQKAGGLAKRQLHSAAGMSRFTGPGMHYHRRAESAPEMVPFEDSRFGLHRFGSSSTMADVFEEDEDEEEESGPDANKSTGSSTPMPETPAEQQDSSAGVLAGNAVPATNTTDADLRTNPQLLLGPRRRGSDLSDSERSQSSSRSRSDHAGNSLHEDVIIEESDDPQLSEFERRIAPGYDSCDSSTPSPRQILKVKDLAPVDVSPLHLPTPSLAPTSPYSMTQSSAFPSPRSPASYDAHRISTAPSSVTEDNFHSLLMGEPGPEVRISVDDIPSLTSSNSTMTRDSMHAYNPQAREPALREQPRPASFTSTAFGRRRSSLASLNRLINTSHGERSKLSMEVPLEGETERKPKVSKTKRLSRMMQFWKPKESNSS